MDEETNLDQNGVVSTPVHAEKDAMKSNMQDNVKKSKESIAIGDPEKKPRRKKKSQKGSKKERKSVSEDTIEHQVPNNSGDNEFLNLILDGNLEHAKELLLQGVDVNVSNEVRF